MQKVESSNVNAIGHDGKETMIVEYRGQSFYGFKGVFADAFAELEKAESVGSHLHKMGIKGTKIPTTHIESFCPQCNKSCHPAAKQCFSCGASIIPKFESEVVREGA